MANNSIVPMGAGMPAPSRIALPTGANESPVVVKGAGAASGGKDLPGSQQDSGAISNAEVMGAVDQMRGFMQAVNRDLHFSIDEDSGITVVRVVDPATDEVVRQIPTEEVMRVVRSLESGGGLLSDVKA